MKDKHWYYVFLKNGRQCCGYHKDKEGRILFPLYEIRDSIRCDCEDVVIFQFWSEISKSDYDNLR
jgi:hypothetical protein